MKKLILGAAIGNCVHVAGVVHFLQLAEEAGYESVFLGPAVSISNLQKAIKQYNPDMIGISYRLTPENARHLLDELTKTIDSVEFEKRIWVFGGTKPVADVAQKYGIFQFISDGTDDIDDSIMFLHGKKNQNEEIRRGSSVTERIQLKYPYPLLRHHYGRPDYQETLCGVKTIAEAGVLDIISLGPDQNTQEFFYHQESMKKDFDGAGGVPLRTREDFIRLKQNSQCGNFPLMRCYSGTADVLRFGGMIKETIDNAWCAVPLCWYNELDGRGTRTIEQSVKDAHELIRWHVKRNIPVEVNEPHHWALRDAHDVMSVAMAYISAYHAKCLGVKDYIAQYMFNVPNALSFSMDLGRICAMMEMVESLHDEKFKTYRQVRAGLPFLCSDPDIAKGQLAASAYLAMSIRPHIIHVVGFCEALHAASADEVIESCKIVRGVVRSVLHGGIDGRKDIAVRKRADELIRQASYLLEFIKSEYALFENPLANPEVIADCVKRGILDAPHILKNSKFRGTLKTKIIDGKCVAYSPDLQRAITEEERLALLLQAERTKKQE